MPGEDFVPNFPEGVFVSVDPCRDRGPAAAPESRDLGRPHGHTGVELGLCSGVRRRVLLRLFGRLGVAGDVGLGHLFKAALVLRAPRGPAPSCLAVSSHSRD